MHTTADPLVLVQNETVFRRPGLRRDRPDRRPAPAVHAGRRRRTRPRPARPTAPATATSPPSSGSASSTCSTAGCARARCPARRPSRRTFRVTSRSSATTRRRTGRRRPSSRRREAVYGATAGRSAVLMHLGEDAGGDEAGRCDQHAADDLGRRAVPAAEDQREQEGQRRPDGDEGTPVLARQP